MPKNLFGEATRVATSLSYLAENESERRVERRIFIFKTLAITISHWALSRIHIKVWDGSHGLWKCRWCKDPWCKTSRMSGHGDVNRLTTLQSKGMGIWRCGSLPETTRWKYVNHMGSIGQSWHFLSQNGQCNVQSKIPTCLLQTAKIKQCSYVQLPLAHEKSTLVYWTEPRLAPRIIHPWMPVRISLAKASPGTLWSWPFGPLTAPQNIPSSIQTPCQECWAQIKIKHCWLRKCEDMDGPDGLTQPPQQKHLGANCCEPH